MKTDFGTFAVTLLMMCLATAEAKYSKGKTMMTSWCSIASCHNLYDAQQQTFL
jgi:hypothetical protein